MFIEIDVDDIPLGDIDVPGTEIETEIEKDKLPKLGENGRLGYYLIGFALISMGLFIRRRYRTKTNQ
ncbi:MAG: LPXTG cell wall anchor domain-containing protein [Clostridia bacterium]|nr:LPXTG cell wall anchor domain-containing protein [Clostridia bacterium]